MRRHRWPALAPPPERGLYVRSPLLLATEKDLILELSSVTAFASGLLLKLALRVTGLRADFARHETRPLTDPQDWSAQWSYLSVRVRSDDLDGPADPRRPSEPDSGASRAYRTTPTYWIGGYPRSGSLTVTVGWTEIGLHPVTFTLALGPNPFPTAFGSESAR
ncbi:hypothetical protein [Rhodococcus sp. BUPNP1]|uniref:hypothetical protein n=1 Tax=Rhodococcus sp. BUPNP1 TaxID=1432786 RepID=UPI000B5AB9C3|nr:hypothetical protein [Rhodococcus sp. BUPNP1]OWY81525.1 hypothetical protein B9C99_12745 [Rhodococcus sp. BUPNP1]